MQITEPTLVRMATIADAYARGKTAGEYDRESCFPYCPDSLQEDYQVHFEQGYNEGYESAQEGNL